MLRVVLLVVGIFCGACDMWVMASNIGMVHGVCVPMVIVCGHRVCVGVWGVVFRHDDQFYINTQGEQKYNMDVGSKLRVVPTKCI